MRNVRNGGNGGAVRLKEVRNSLFHMVRQLLEVEEYVSRTETKRIQFVKAVREWEKEVTEERNSWLKERAMLESKEKLLRERADVFEKLLDHEKALRAEQDQHIRQRLEADTCQTEADSWELEEAMDMKGITKAMREKTDKLRKELAAVESALDAQEKKIKSGTVGQAEAQK